MTLDVTTLPQHEWRIRIWPVFNCETSYELVREGEGTKFPSWRIQFCCARLLMIYTRTAAQPAFWFCQYPSPISTARWVNRVLAPRSAGCSNLSKRLNPYNCIFRKETASNKQFHFCGNLTRNNIKSFHNVEIPILQSVRMAHKIFYAGLQCLWEIHCPFPITFHWGFSWAPLRNITVRFNIIYRTRWFIQ